MALILLDTTYHARCVRPPVDQLFLPQDTPRLGAPSSQHSTTEATEPRRWECCRTGQDKYLFQVKYVRAEWSI